jgi:hypothetical protein
VSTWSDSRQALSTASLDLEYRENRPLDLIEDQCEAGGSGKNSGDESPR